MHTYPYYDRFDIKQVGNRLLGFTSISRNFSRPEFRCVTECSEGKYDLIGIARDYARLVSFYLSVKIFLGENYSNLQK